MLVLNCQFFVKILRGVGNRHFNGIVVNAKECVNTHLNSQIHQSYSLITQPNFL